MNTCFKILLILIAFRLCSGVQNGVFYGSHTAIIPIVSAVMIMIVLYTYTWYVYGREYSVLKTIARYLLFASGLSIVLMAVVLLWRMNEWIHFLEYMVTGTYGMAILILYPFEGVLGMYPGLVLHKIAINILSGVSWDYNGTDDPTGATTGIDFFQWHFVIPRIDFYDRIILAVSSLILYAIIYFFGNRISIFLTKLYCHVWNKGN